MDNVVDRGREARWLLEHPLLAEAFASIEAGIMARWLHASAAEVRETAWHQRWALEQLRAWLEATVLTGEFSSNGANYEQ